MSLEPRIGPQCAKDTLAIAKVLRSRGLEQARVIGAIKRIGGAKRWRVGQLTKDGEPYPDQIFEVVDGRMAWRAAT